MAFDSAVSIGGRSLLDGIWRVLQPAVAHLQGWLPLSIPGMTNASMRVTRFVPVERSSLGGVFQVMAFVEARGEVLVTASVQAGTLRLTLGDVRLSIPTSTATLTAMPVESTLTIPADATAGTISLPTGAATIGLSDLTGTVTSPMHTESISLPATVATLAMPVDAGNLGIPLPAVVPIPIELTSARRPASVNVFLALDARSEVDAASGFGVMIQQGGEPLVGTVAPDLVPAAELARTLTRDIEAVVRQLLGGLSIAQPVIDVTAIANRLAESVRAAIGEALRSGFLALAGRTGKVVFPPAAAGSSCEVALLPTHANAQLVYDGSVPGHYLQIAFARSAPVGDPLFPFFTPSGPLDVQVDISNEFLRDLLCCLIEKLPVFSFSTVSTPVSDGRGVCCDWSGVTLQVGIFSLTGKLSLCIARTADGTKEILISGAFTSPSALLDLRANFTLVLAADLDDLAHVTSLRLTTVRALDVGVKMGGGLIALIIIGAIFTIIVPGWTVVIAGVPLLIVAYLDAQLRGLFSLMLSRLREGTSPAAVPPAVFEAFGRLASRSIRIDDLVARGTMSVPSSPWALTPSIAPAELFPTQTHVPEAPP
ncbi:hypothetical protein [Longimicrobium sp.]|uniref:hypothetical protein n=1 Tax=Longimicrobium sp. TaxID=2029185 RepID=UPI002C4D02A2|nr:hypothetical protein [Longimicrobium sp.]HSU17999.1 hypothetical protein [Longimicrobium sp.]